MKVKDTATPQLKWVCLSCGLEYLEEKNRCDSDGSELAAIQVDSLLGTVFADKYRLESLIGRGGMSSIYKAKHLLMDKYVAVKLMHVFLLSNSQNIRRFQIESKAASALNHPNLITVHDFGVTNDGIPFLVMDFIDGRSLDDLLKEHEFMQPEHCLSIIGQVMEGLEKIHEQGIIHRDLKPSNVMLSSDSDSAPRVRIVDFGIAKMLESSDANANLTMTGEILGSPPYMSPEQCLGKAIDARSDIYALGCMIYQCLTGQYPIMGATPLETFQMQISEPPRPFTEICPRSSVPAIIEDVVLKALEKDPQRRFQSVAEFRKCLFDAYDKSKEQEALQFLAARLNSRFRRLRQRVNQNLLTLLVTVAILSTSIAALIYFNPTCRQMAHVTVNQSLYALCLSSGRLAAWWNYDLAKSLLLRAVQESDFSKVADNRINSRDYLQMLYERYGYRAEANRIDNEIKTIKSDWLVSRFSIKMGDEDKASEQLLKAMPVPSDAGSARLIALLLNDLAGRSLKRGAYNLAEEQAQKSLYISSQFLHERPKQTLEVLNLLSLSLERAGKLSAARAQSERLLQLAKADPPEPAFEASAALTLGRIELIMGNNEKAEDWLKQSINYAATPGSNTLSILKDALADEASLLRRVHRFAEAQAVEKKLTELEKDNQQTPHPERTFR